MASYIFGGAFVESLPNHITFQLVSQRSFTSINNKNSKILTKRPPVATTIPSGTQRLYWGIGMTGFTFASSMQARVVSRPSCSSAHPVTTVYRVSNGRPHLQLYSRGAYNHYLSIVFCEYGKITGVIWRKITYINKFK